MDVTTTRGTCRVVSGGRSEGPGPTCWMLVSVPGWAPRPRGGGAGGAIKGYYLLRLTGRLSLVCVCFFLLQPVRLYWWCPRLPTGGRTPPLPTELYVPPWLWLWEPFRDSFMPLCCL